MERLTSTNLRKACNDPWDYCGLDNVCKRDCFEPTSCKIPKIVDRLAAYEDTGLEPETVSKIRDIVLDISGNLDRLRELAQADRENRVLPEGSGWFVTCSGKKLTVVMDIEAALRREQDG